MHNTGFLDIIHKKFGNSPKFHNLKNFPEGAANGQIYDRSSNNFMFATGIECSYPTIQHGKLRRDMLQECGHYMNWKKDLHLVKNLGLKYLRYGLPYFNIHLGPDKYDWSFADVAMQEIQKLGIVPILDLLHFGLPDWLGNFQNPEFPIHFANYAGAVAERYPWVRYYTPVNEIYVTAKMSAKDGCWNEQLRSDKAFVTALKHLTAASILAASHISKNRPDVIIVQSESAEYTHELRAEKSAEISLINKQRFISLDLLYAHVPDAEVFIYLFDNGLTREEYNWFMAGEPCGYQVMGNDYYGRNEKIMKPDGTLCSAEDVLGWYQITHQYFKRYNKPVMHTETNTFDADLAPAWLWKQWVNVLQMREDGVPVLGFTWYSLTDQIDWDCGLSEKNDTVNACGLYDLKRNPRPVAQAYTELLKEFGKIDIVPHGAIFQISENIAEFKSPT